MSVKVSNLTKSYGRQNAVDNISFEIKTGEIAGFIGPNGAGKSTTMKILTGYLPSSSGEAFVNNISIFKNSLEIRRQIGYLPEHNPLYPEMYIKEFLEYAAGTYKIKATKKVIDNIIEMTGLGIEQRKKIGALSKGYRQRVGLAQALIHNPSVLILDEPTTGLDPNQIIEIRNLISEIGKEKTVMLSTHIMQEVEAICDRIIIINQGKIVANENQGNIHTASKENYLTFVVEFDNEVEINKIEEMEDVTKALSVDKLRFVIQSDKDIRKKLFDFAVANNIAVLSMQKKEKTLEEIFQELTKN
ncbi:MAG: gliding motility-associated ABC transporter ATP-binding subunit GldA [Bacteroidales bacterium]|nr:gliding motility-associated ABC transporter ATP-binding subunit GldA [Bacteroidales bacterium]